MDSTSKSKKQSMEANFKESEDRLSNLPSDLIGHIFSFLPTKNVVATSLLSTKWKHLWTTLSTFDFDDELVSKESDSTHPSVEKNFVNFVYRVLLLCTSDMQKFRLKCSHYFYDVSNLNAWVSTALFRNIRELDFFFPMAGQSFMLPSELFLCSTLVVLKLGSNFSLGVPTLVSLPNLKTLHLKSIEFLDDDSIGRLFCSCSVLEELTMVGCKWENIRVVRISVASLESLVMKSPTKSSRLCSYRIELDTPNLQHLKFTGNIPRGYSGKSPSSTVKGHIDVGHSMKGRLSNLSKPVRELLKGICNVQCLYISGAFTQVAVRVGVAVRVAVYEKQTFHNLTYLEVDIDTYTGPLLIVILGLSPNLETLVIFVLQQDEDDTPEYAVFKFANWRCLLFCLKLVKIIGYKGQPAGLEMAEYFLKNAKVLNKLMINVDRSLTTEEELEITKKVMTFPRTSRNCKVEVY